VGRADPRRARCDISTVTTSSATPARPACGRPSRGSTAWICEPARRRRVAPRAGCRLRTSGRAAAARAALDPLSLSVGWDAAARSEDSDAIRSATRTCVRAGGRDLRPTYCKGRLWNGIMSYVSIRCVRTLLRCVSTEVGFGLCVSEACDPIRSVLTLLRIDTSLEPLWRALKALQEWRTSMGWFIRMAR
jgi:hypothetical protein